MTLHARHLLLLCAAALLLALPAYTQEGGVPPTEGGFVPTQPDEVTTPAAPTEAQIATKWCKAISGNAEQTLADGSRPDCSTSTQVHELDFATGLKPYECAGQALHYAALTGKNPACVLILRSTAAASAEFANAHRRASSHGKVQIYCINEKAEAINCLTGKR